MALPIFVASTEQVFINNTPKAVSVPAGTQAGDILLAFMTAETGATNSINYPAGWTQLQRNPPNAFRNSFILAVCTSDGSSTYDFSTVGTNTSITMAAYRGVNTIGNSGIVLYDNTAGNTATTPVLAITGGDVLEVISCAYVDTRSSTITAPEGPTNRIARNTFPTLNVADIAVSGTNTTAKNFTLAVSGVKRAAASVLLAGAAAPAAQVPQGTTTIGTISGVTASAASVPFTYSASDQTGFEYRLNGTGTPVSVAVTPIALSGLTASTTYTVEVRAVNATGSGTWSSPVQFTTSAAAQAPQGAVTVGSVASITHNSASVPFTYSASDQTGFQYSLNGTANPVTVPGGTSPIALSGLTANTAYTIQVRAVNATGNGTWSAVRNFTTAAAPQVPQGTFTVGTITVGQTTASVPYAYSASDQTSIQYRLGGTGTPQTATASPQSLTGLTPGTAHTIEFRAVNTTGNGVWSSVANFTTTAPVTASLTLTDLSSNSNVPWSNTSSITVDVYNVSTGALVVRKTGLTSTAGADLVVSDAALVAGTTYNVVISIGAAIGAAKVTAA